MREFSFTIYQHVKDSIGEIQTKNWGQWTEIFSVHAVRGDPTDTSDKEKLEKNKNGPAVVLGEIRGNRSAKNVVAVHAMALDLENQTPGQLGSTIDKITPFTWILYSTHKSGSEVVGKQTRLRVILPLREPLNPLDYPKAWFALQTLVGGANDPQTKDLARLHFLPSTHDKSKAIFHAHEGKLLEKSDLDAIKTNPLLDEIQIKSRYLPKDSELKASIKKLLAGQTLADPGHRHEKILQVTAWLAKYFPNLSDETLTALFANSLAQMKAQPNGGPIEQKEIQDAYAGALNLNPTALANPHAYSQDELEQIAKRHNWSVGQLYDRWLIQKSGVIWILDQDGDYQGPFGKEDAPVAARKLLTRAPVQLWIPTANGFRPRTLIDLVADHGTLAKKTVASIGAQISHYDAESQTMIEAVVPLRKDLAPIYHPEIDTWLDEMTKDASGKLKDWLACCPDTSKPLCALYLDGESDSGKTLFALGAARLWTKGGAAEVEQVLANFNEELLRCPLIFADEQVPKNWGGQSASAKLRALLGIRERTLKRKYLPNTDLTGAIRIIMAANNESLLDELDAHTAADLEAVAQRFLYVKIDEKKAVAYLQKFEKSELDSWASRKIAEHALWLREHREVKPGRKFYVEGDLTQIHRLLLTGGHWTSLICEWLLRYLLNPKPFHSDSEVGGLVRIENARLLVNEQALADKWDLYLKNVRQDPQVRQIGQALRAISEEPRKQLRWSHRQIRYRVVITSHLIAWSERHGIGDEQAILDRLSGAVPLEKSLESPEKTPEKERNFADF